MARPRRVRRGALLGAGALLLALLLALVLWLDRPRPAAVSAPSSTPASGPEAADASVAGRTIEGEVQDDLGKPLGAALVRAVLDDPGAGMNAAPLRETQTDASGRFRLGGVPAGAVTLEVTREGHEGKEHTLRPDQAERVTFVLARQGELLVTLRDSPGQPVEGAELVITGPGLWPAQAARASAAGEHVFKALPAGEYRVRARRGARVALAPEPVAVVPGARGVLELVLVEGVTVTGSVVDAHSKKPLAAARVTIQDLTPGLDAISLVSDARGQFEASGLWPGAVRFEAQRDDYATATRDLMLPQHTRVELALSGASALSGSIVDADGAPLAGARLSVATREGLPVELGAERTQASGAGELGVTSGPVPAIPLFEGGEFALGTLATESDRSGRFRIGRLAPVPIVLHVTRSGYQPERLVIADLKPHAEKSELRIVLRAAGRVVGKIVDARGRPLSAVYVAARAGELEKSALTDARGEYVIADVLGEVQLEAQPDGHTTTRCRAVVAARGEARCDLRAHAAVHELTVRVLDSYGMGLEGALVTLLARAAADAPQPSVSQLSRRDGSVVLRELPDPPYTLDVALAGHVGVDDLPVSRADQEVRVTLSRAGALAGSVVDALGRAVPGALVGTEEGSASAETNAQGLFVLSGVRPGPHVVLAHESRAGEGRSHEVRARAGERLDDIRIMLKGRYEGPPATERAPGEGAARATKEREPRSELELEQRGRAVVVTHVAAASAAAKAGLRTGDVISAVDGEPALSAAQARGMLHGPAGRAAIVRVLRSKQAVNLRYRRAGL